MKKTFKQLMAGATCLLMAFNVVACGGSSTTGGKKDQTTIYIANTGGGVGEEWLTQAAERFSKSVAEESYEEGKKGVYVDIFSSTGVTTSNMSTDGYSMYFTERSGTARTLSQAGLALDITDIVTEKVYENGTKAIVDSVKDDYLSALKGTDGQYYALPHFEIYPTLTYNKAIFDANGIYFAAPGETNVDAYSCDFGKANMVGLEKAAKKSCGIDGKYNTFDDGLPTTYRELLIFCNYMDEVHTVTPFTVAGGHIDYYNYLVEGIMSSLMGAESFKGMFSFDKEMEIVTGYETDKELLDVAGIGIKKPITIKETITNATGYKVRQTAARYYAVALTEILHDRLWMAPDSSNNNSNHSKTQANFIMGGVKGQKKVGMLIEGSQWVNEAINSRHFESFEQVAQKKSELGIMPFPVSLDTPITTENKGATRTVMDFGTSYMFVNKKVSNNPGLVRAIKDFIQFIYQEEELQQFTKVTGVLKASMEYDYNTSDIKNNLLPLQKEIIEYREKSNMVYQTSNNEVFFKGWGDFILAIDAPLFNGSYGTVRTSEYLTAVRRGKTTKEIFENFFISESDWNSRYLGA